MDIIIPKWFADYSKQKKNEAPRKTLKPHNDFDEIFKDELMKTHTSVMNILRKEGN